MPNFDVLEGGAESEQELVRTLIARVASRGAASLDAVQPEVVRVHSDRVLAVPTALGGARREVFPASAENGRRRRPRRSAFITALGVAAVVVALVALTLSVGTNSTPAPTNAPAAWRLASVIDPAAQSFSSTATAPVPGANQSLTGITCPTTSVCYATMQTEVTAPINGSFFQTKTGDSVPPGSTATYEQTTGVFVSETSGASWSPVTLPAGVALNTKLTCPSATTCMAGANRASRTVGTACVRSCFS